MKRIFIAIQYMELGGAERALLGLLEALDTVSGLTCSFTGIPGI